MGSTPTFDPAVYTKPRISPSLYRQLTSEETESPLTNRAIQGLYPTGSTFKLATATAALEEGLIGADTPVYDGGSIEVGGIEFGNAGGVSYGTITMRRALQVSSDVYFYKLGLESDATGDDPIQKWTSRLGIGAPTGIDLPSEFGGLIPTPEWRNELYRKGDTDRPWSAGDSVNLSVGQGDLQVTPLQLATAYATVANGGDVVTPHLGARVEDPTGRVVQEIAPGPRRRLDISGSTRRTILDGLRAAAMEPGGTSYGVFGGFPVQIAGKTGTAERPPHGDQSWYVAVAPYEDPEVVVAVTIERGGFGAETAAPAASEILQRWFAIQPGKIKTPENVEGAYE
jgi:penicillin-binding protein 2